jgi:hypothetical protein
MAFDQPTRNALAKMVGDCRRLLTDDIRKQLQGVFGLQPDGTVLPIASLGHLDERGREIARELREWQDHLAANEVGTETKRRAAAFDRLVRETSFTALNRLAALRLCEERGHVIECVRRGMASDGFQLFERLGGGALGTRGETYRVFFERMFDELAVDLGVLFDLRAPQSLVFPGEQTLERVLGLLNDPVLCHLWTEDETIGWVYQYFNSKEEREAMRKASQAPRNSRELAVRNQFFTPRYVVEFLADNTLGRMWYEMRKGSTRLGEQCRYLVRQPSEDSGQWSVVSGQESDQGPVISGQAEDGSEPTTDHRPLTTDSDHRPPTTVPHRAKKDPRDLRLLDPACGSAHFLLYGFDLLEVIYEEAWADKGSPASDLTGKTLREDYPDLETLRREIPGLILRHNLYGIDIDPRACQIAALALWLRAQRSYQCLGLKAGERPIIRKSNIVCAEPMPGEDDLLADFCAQLRPRLLGQLVETVFERMKLAGEAGSLLKVEEDLRDAIQAAKREWLERPKQEQFALFAEPARRKAEQLPLFDLSGISDEQFWHDAEARVLDEVRRYAEHASNGRGYLRRLFADDTERGFAFADVCRQRFDIVLMNPPFGEASKPSKSYIEKRCPRTKHDVYAAFVERGIEVLHERGMLGAITSRTGFFLSSFQKWREEVLLKEAPPVVFADLGYGVLDSAMVEVAAYCLQRAEVQ